MLTKVTLSNKKGKIQILDNTGKVIDTVEYAANQVKEGKEIVFV